MNYNNPSELDRMKELIGFGMKSGSASSSEKKQPVVEYKVKAADGKTYGIVNEGNKFYIKVAPKKDTQVVNEDFDYIGGFNNRKQNEYGSYNMASKQLELKLKHINEAYAPKATIELPKSVSSDWQVAETKELRESIDSFRRISNNVSYILAEDKKGMTLAHTLPEAPASNPSAKQVNAPFTDTAVANGDKDFKGTKEDHTKAGPFDSTVKDAERKLTSDKAPGKGNSDETYGEAAKYVPDGAVADKKPSGRTVTHVKGASNESRRRTFKLTEEQVLAWNDDMNYMDTTRGTEIGDTAPYTENPVTEESDVMHNSDNQNVPTPGAGGIGSTAPFTKGVNEATIEADDAAGLPDEDEFELDDENIDVPFPEVEDDEDAEIEVNSDDDAYAHEDDEFDSVDDHEDDFSDKEENLDDLSFEIDLDDDYVNPDFGFGGWDESRSRRGRKMTEGKLDLGYGKHPAWRKKPMTTPPNREVAPNGARDWNDDSAKSDAPYAQKIGSSAPFDAETIDLLTDAVMESLGWAPKKGHKA